jgi:alkyldihydroxyacetonephosphate synthase
MAGSKKSFKPGWYEDQAAQDSYRSLFKWGSLSEFKHPNSGLYKLMKQTFNMNDADFQTPHAMGLEPVQVEIPPQLQSEQIETLQCMVGIENTRSDTYSRIKASYGKGMLDALRLRQTMIENIPDIVLHPRHKDDIIAILKYCVEQRIPVYIFGGGSSVTRGMEAVKGGVTLDMSVHMKRVLEFNETNMTIRVEAGMWGPELENMLQNAPTLLNAARSYTCGHFPQSFEYSSVGGWVVTRGAGQNSTFFGKIEDMVIAQEYVTPQGLLETRPFPRSAIGPDLNQIMIGSEGCFGVLANVTLKVHRWMPKNCRYSSYMFRSWQDGLQATRELMQSDCGFPSVFRLSDPEETDVAMRLYGVEETPASSLLKTLGYKPMERCMLLGTVDGERGYTRNVSRMINKISLGLGAFPLTGWVTKIWEHSRFRDPYLREDLGDYGVVIDTLECAVTWSQLPQVHSAVRNFVKSRPHTVCMTHCSHFYPQGTNLYFIFIARMNSIQEYLELQYGILEAIQKNGAAMSHHHGMGKQTAPWLEGQIGSSHMDVLRSLKQHFDPHHILNPGGTLGFDMSDDQKNKVWNK